MGSEELARWLRAEIRRRRNDLLDLYSAEHFDVVHALEIQREIHRLLDRLKDAEERP